VTAALCETQREAGSVLFPSTAFGGRSVELKFELARVGLRSARLTASSSITVTLQTALLVLSTDVTVTLAVPTASAVSKPFESTDTTASLSDCHLTGSTGFVPNCRVVATRIVTESGFTLMPTTGTVVTVLLAVLPPSTEVAVMVTTPWVRADTRPSEFTTAIVVSLEVHTTAGLAIDGVTLVVNRTVSPISTVAVAGVILRLITSALRLKINCGMPFGCASSTSPLVSKPVLYVSCCEFWFNRTKIN